jgi:hypothetical protein
MMPTGRLGNSLDRASDNQLQFWSTQRLVENGWEYEDGRNVMERGWDRMIYNQREFGVLTKDTLRCIIEQQAPLLLC